LTDKLLTTSKYAVLSEASIKELLDNNKNVVQNLTQIEVRRSVMGFQVLPLITIHDSNNF
jgi:hypothetical protein